MQYCRQNRPQIAVDTDIIGPHAESPGNGGEIDIYLEI